MIKWEYRVVEIEYPTLKDLSVILENYGKEGWELVRLKSTLFIFKRPLL